MLIGFCFALFHTGDQPQPGGVLHVPETFQQGNANAYLTYLTDGKQGSWKFHTLGV